VLIDVTVGVPLTLDAAGTRDPDANALTYRWFFYAEAGTASPASRSPAGRPGRSAVAAPPVRAVSRQDPRAARVSRRRASR
jgi:hypothetical protein